jgi:hypothetical protein
MGRSLPHKSMIVRVPRPVNGPITRGGAQRGFDESRGVGSAVRRDLLGPLHPACRSSFLRASGRGYGRRWQFLLAVGAKTDHWRHRSFRWLPGRAGSAMRRPTLTGCGSAWTSSAPGAANIKDLELPLLLPGIKINHRRPVTARSARCSSRRSAARAGSCSTRFWRAERSLARCGARRFSLECRRENRCGAPAALPSCG